ncbi:hypothetical protein CKO31_07185 [Thiohalocapsa halophila]|uniref:ABC transmembrane type-1 domain-containing protein n=1 Tax=Thiohalocapsa halophila TaxID=69359 RepID=A0ABS1CF35_9GAMM|nr:ABC transporter permease subunit [Thiohalocapsa halophila]MBK1630531.1 hypothetical protein [Thiohalocapsa halophila]
MRATIPGGVGTISAVAAVLVLCLCLAPFGFVLVRALGSGDFAALGHLAGTVLPVYVANSALVAGLATLVAIAVGVGGAFLVSFYEFWGRRKLTAALVLPLVLPPYLVAVVYRELSHLVALAPRVDSPLAAALVFALTLYPFVYLLTRAAFLRLAGSQLEAGQSLGIARAEVLRRALLPLAAPGILLGGLLVALEAISDFGSVDALGVRTLTTAIYRIWFSMFDANLAAQVAVIALLLPLMLVGGYALLTRGRGFANPTNRPRPPGRIPLSPRLGALAASACALPVVLGFGLPLLTLLAWAGGAFAVLRLESLYADVASTLLVATATAALTLLLGTWLAIQARAARDHSWSSAPLWVLSLNYAMPSIVLAIALLFLTGWSYTTELGSALADSLVLILLATTLRFAVIAHFSAESGLRSLSLRLDEAVRCTGRGGFHGLVRVLLPQLRGPLTVAGLLVFVMSARDLTLSLVLQPFGYGSLPLSIHHYAELDLYGAASVYALCLALVLLYPVLALERRLAQG